MKKFLSVILAVCLIVAMVPMGALGMTASAANVASGTTGNCTWTLDDTVLTISGNGDMAGYDTFYPKSAPWGTSITKVIIEDGVTCIGDCAFYRCTSLTSVTIPDSVTAIGYKAFYNCSSLTNVTIPNSVIAIYDCAFEFCEGLTSITIPNSVTSIADGAFASCGNLRSVVLPEGLTVLNNSVFGNCYNLSKVYIPKSLTLIKNANFAKYYGYYTSLTVCYRGNEDDWAKITVSDNNARLLEATVKYNRTGLPIEVKNYGDWKVEAETSGVYSIAPSTAIDGFETENVMVFDKNNKEVKYNADKLGWPLVKGENYTVKLKYCDDKEAYDNVVWKLTLKSDTIFPDTSANDWYNDAVNYAVGSGIMKGYGATGLFGTANNLQREEFILMLARYEGVDLDKYEAQESKFSDVPEGAWFEGAINWGAEKGIITGYGNTGVFGVGDTITREQLVLMLCRYAKSIGKDVTVGADAATNATAKFVDFGNVSDWATDAVLWAVEKGVITGAGAQKNLINPQGNAQRCEIAQIMYNIYKNNVL